MLKKIINETSDFINFKFPGLIFLHESVFQSNSDFSPIVKNNGQNPRKNFKILFENEAEILKSQALINKKKHPNLLNLAKDLNDLLHLEEEMLFNNDKILKLERKFSKDLNSFAIDIKLLIEVIKSNLTIDSKVLFQKMIQKEILEINQKLLKLHANFKELSQCEIDSFFNVADFIKVNQIHRYFEGFSYENSYQTLINFFEMSAINLNYACEEAQKAILLSRPQSIDESQTAPLFFEIQKMISESQKFLLKNENNIIACILNIYNKLKVALKTYMEVSTFLYYYSIKYLF